MRRGWYGCDFDGTLVTYDGWKGPDHVGEPIPKMVKRIQAHLDAGDEVRIVTARISPYTKVLRPDEPMPVGTDPAMQRAFEAACAIATLCREQFGRVLPITCMKDYGMIHLYDDRVKQVIPNEGCLVEDLVAEYAGYVAYLINEGWVPLDEDNCFTFPDGTVFHKGE